MEEKLEGERGRNDDDEGSSSIVIITLKLEKVIVVNIFRGCKTPELDCY